MLVHPAMNGPHGRVLILGGGDGLAAREVLRYPDVSSVTLVDLDPAVVSLARSFEPVSSLTHGSLSDPRLSYVAADAFTGARARLSGPGLGRAREALLRRDVRHAAATARA